MLKSLLPRVLLWEVVGPLGGGLGPAEGLPATGAVPTDGIVGTSDVGFSSVCCDYH